MIISGPSGVGKGTLIQDVITNHSSLCLAVSTTRSPRSGEVNGDDYHFLNNDEFDHHVMTPNFLSGAMSTSTDTAP